MADEPIVHIQVCHEADEYKDFWTSAAANQVADKCGNALQLIEVVSTLLLNWRAFSYGAGMPVVLAASVPQTFKGFNEAGNKGMLLEIGPMIVTALAGRVPELCNEPELAKKLTEEAIILGSDLHEKHRELQFEYPFEQAWKEYTQESVFNIYIWGTMRLCYLGVYNAYEDFLVRVVRHILKLKLEDRLRATDDEFKKTFIKHFTEPVWNKCWTSKGVKDMKAIRHALTHASGRITREMTKENVKIDDVKGVIQILPYRLREEYKSLAECVLAVIDKAVSMECFA